MWKAVFLPLCGNVYLGPVKTFPFPERIPTFGSGNLSWDLCAPAPEFSWGPKSPPVEPPLEFLVSPLCVVERQLFCGPESGEIVVSGPSLFRWVNPPGWAFLGNAPEFPLPLEGKKVFPRKGGSSTREVF